MRTHSSNSRRWQPSPGRPPYGTRSAVARPAGQFAATRQDAQTGRSRLPGAAFRIRAGPPRGHDAPTHTFH